MKGSWPRTPEQLERHRAYMKAWKARNADRARENDRRSRARIKENPERLAHYREYQRKYQKKLREKYGDIYRDKARARYHANPDANRETARNSAKRLKQEVFEHYGNKCTCCGESSLVFLTMDHIWGNGSDHRKYAKVRSGTDFYRWLKKQDYPTDYQILCYNCNMAKGTGECCPHKMLMEVLV